jgi:uncharacterized phiE125 gp8 family phage protein
MKHNEPNTTDRLASPNYSEWWADLLAFFKDQHLRINTGEDEDRAIRQYLDTALDLFEFHSHGRVVLASTFIDHKTRWGTSERPLRLSKAKASSITEVRYYDQGDVLRTLDPDDYAYDLTGTQGVVWMKDGADWPELNAYRPRPVQVEYQAGWQPTAVPADVKTGVFLLATHFYQFKGDEDQDIPQGFVRLANKYQTGNIYFGG